MATMLSRDNDVVRNLVDELAALGVDLDAREGVLHVLAPKGVIDAALAARISDSKPGILCYLETRKDALSEGIAPVDRSAPLPLGFVQQRMWLHGVLEPDTVLYNLPAAWRLHGPLDQEAFSSAVAAVFARHEILRVSIRSEDDEPSQCFLPAGDVELSCEDLSSLAAAERERLLDERLCAFRDKRIDLEAGVPYHAGLIRMAPEEHVFFLIPHHVVWDGWSFDIFLRELDERYAAAIEGRSSDLPDLPIQYADYAVWHRNWLHSGALQEQLAYWSEVLSGELAPLELATDHPRPPRFSHRGDWEEFSLSAETIERITHLAAAHRGTSFMVLLAAWMAFMYRISGQDDIVVGVPIQARQIPEVTDLIGCFVNTLCLRQRIDPEASFADLVDAVRDTSLGAYEHQDAPIDMLVERLVTQRDPSRTPLFQTMFSHQQVSRRPQRIGPLALSQAHVNPAAAPTDLMLAVMEGSSGARAVIHYSTDLFSDATIARMRMRFEHFLAASLADPSTSIRALPVATPEEQQVILEQWNATTCNVEGPATLGRLLGPSAWRSLHTPAITFEGETVDYAELDARVNRLAHALRARGIGRGSLVGLCVERSAQMVIAQLAVLRAGAAYVPLDPAYPPERLAYMAEDAHLSLLITQSALADTMAWPRDQSLWLDGDAAAIHSQPESALPADTARDACPEDPAYVIYTSGSTGKPKGVVVPHRSVVNFLASMSREPGLRSTDRLLAVTTLSFDIAVLELLLPLSVGAEVVLASRDQVTDGAKLRALLASRHVTVMQATPTTWQMLIEAGWQGGRDFRALVGGESLPPDLAQQLLDRCGELWNMYGPTETTIWSTCCRVESLDGGISIGRPIANTQVHVLDAHGEVCPVGVAGEIHIGGAGVTLGYLQRAELTAERFLPDPFSSRDGARLYRTGDRGRWRADGMLEHLGRLDFQVKVRGYRIELGEIEARVAEQSGVARAVVVVREDRPGDVRLVAYVLPESGQVPEDAVLRKALKALLPEYMVPQHFVVLDALPLTPNGKIDRKALPTPDTGGEQAMPRIAPRNHLERSIALVMAKVLGVPEVGIDDNFFESGGHSLLAMRFTSRLNRELKTSLSLRTLFDHPSVAQLAQVIDEGICTDASLPDIPIRDRQHEAPLSLMQRSLWLMQQFSGDQTALNLPLAYRLKGPLDARMLDRALQQVVRRQAVLRTSIDQTDDGVVQRVHDDIRVSLLPVQDLGAIPDASREHALATRLERLVVEPFEFSSAPLFRARLFRLADDEHVLQFVAHHAIWDGWSFDLFRDELACAYEALCTDTVADLPLLAQSYGDFSAWQREWATGESAREQVGHWLETLTPLADALELPVDAARPATMSGEGQTIPLEIPTATTERARSLGQSREATLFMTILACYIEWLHRLTGQEDLVLGIPVLGRDQAGTEPVMGLFRNTLPIRFDIRPDWSFLDLLDSVRARMLDALATPQVPFEELMRGLGVARDFSRHPVYQALFSFQDAGGQRRPWHGGLQLQSLKQYPRGVTEDVGLWLHDTMHGLEGGLAFNADILSRGTVEGFLAQFMQLLESALASPDIPLAKLNMLPAAERARIDAWNDTGADCQPGQSIHGLFEAQARRTPSRIALRDATQGTSMDYAALEARANRIAHVLRRRGVHGGSLVGLCLERDFDMVAAVLAVLKTGAAYVPLDPVFPRERLEFMASDANLAYMVSTREAIGSIEWPQEQTLLLDEDADAVRAASDVQVDGDAQARDPEAVAYVLYTSGSTGKPKGVQVPHRAVVNFLASMQRVPGLGIDDRLLAVTTLSFDIAALELFLPLMIGAEVVIANREQAGDGHALAELIGQHGITMMQATPTTWRLLLEAGWSGDPRMRALVGGEALPPDLARQLLGRCGELWNMYGPTETTVWSTCCRVESLEAGISIGRPIANTQVHVLDAHGQLCPIGVPGEIHIGGAGVTQGYLHRPELTADRFVPDPFVADAGARLYRTGDRGRWRTDGMLEHLGRLDFQVKVRGFRIELGEIEARLAEQPGVARVVVVVREDRPGDKRLVAYMVADMGQAPDEQDLRSHLRSVLPDYMVPQHFVVLQDLPLTPNGKLDRKALPMPQVKTVADRVGQGGIGEAGKVRDPRQQYLVEIWSELLGIEAGPEDNFFDLGGHSMLAVQMSNRVAKDLGVRIKLMPLATQTLGQLAVELPEMTATRAPGPWRIRAARGIRRLLRFGALLKP